MRINSDGRIIYPESPGLPQTLPAALAADQPVAIDPWGGETGYLSALAPLQAQNRAHPLGWRILRG